MLDLCFRPQRETLDMIELRLSVIPYVVIDHMIKCHNWILWLNLINSIPWFYLIGSTIWFKLISSIFWSDLIKSYFLGRFNYFDSNCYFLHLPVEYGELRSQLYSR